MRSLTTSDDEQSSADMPVTLFAELKGKAAVDLVDDII